MERVATFAVRLDTLEETEITTKHVGIINLSIFVTYKAACLVVMDRLVKYLLRNHAETVERHRGVCRFDSCTYPPN
ncbi:hypothetical protein NVP1197A_23 [Vibrio phage 1.197.A._10N.286.54.F2]|nr:hypothetical protein NVP1197A_23 [Vibrio phage 1.197.A._10N.286.54.F2]